MIVLLLAFTTWAYAKNFYQYTYDQTDKKTIIGYSIYETDKCYRISLSNYQQISQKNGEKTAEQGKYFFNIFKDKNCTKLEDSESEVQPYTIEQLKNYNIFEKAPAETNKCQEITVEQFGDKECTEPIPGTKQFVCNTQTDVQSCTAFGKFYTKVSTVHGYQGTFYYSDPDCKTFTGLVTGQRKCNVCTASSPSNEEMIYKKVRCDNDC
ncbi:hypothetical protein EDI_063000 [Entamoeba dispar SAW760]|uniref:Uncharacterized protein n=1 Tax=Entamoeba dispar (strain ATCC PRA-260 / SAW760) TaxID=370354 RepID=B0EPZ0_ENTDS|nr:uncharacterized protein EDI_063000 [Entamoeba dispar SAW760]EDR23402.1 hypothetical protein EDI_063000 [Entamoeba dispar SAW760]|eukprot:EDR23402.1 hypothetical protein EDI_063000 [Entamoeba dispar SAW760]